jgi:hypothetical protein
VNGGRAERFGVGVLEIIEANERVVGKARSGPVGRGGGDDGWRCGIVAEAVSGEGESVGMGTMGSVGAAAGVRRERGRCHDRGCDRELDARRWTFDTGIAEREATCKAMG